MGEWLARLAVQADHAAGGSHWAHDPSSLHLTLRSLEPYREFVPPSDAAVASYAMALDRAAELVSPFQATVWRVDPHERGVGVHLYAGDDSLDRLDQLIDQVLRGYGTGTYQSWSRTLRYINLIHFAAPVAVQSLLAWSDPLWDTFHGVARFETIELVRYYYTGRDMQPVVLHAARLAEPSTAAARLYSAHIDP